MARSLNKKYFGNRNIGTAGTGDNGIGGEGVASVVLNALGSYTTRPTFTFSAPQLPGGVTATGTITSEVVAATTSNGLTGEGYEVGDLVTFDGITGVTGYVSAVGSGVGEIQGITFTQEDTSRGEFTTLPADLTDVAVIGGSGTLSTVNIAFRAKAVVITEKGSGYTTAPTSTPTQSVTFTSVALTTDSGSVRSATNQENAIVPYAYVTGGSNKIGDIIRQVGARRYKVKTADGTMVCQLVTDGVANAAGEMTITATDANGNTYYVSKLTARLAVLVRLTDDGDDEDWVYATGARAPWSFAEASGLVVSIANK